MWERIDKPERRKVQVDASSLPPIYRWMVRGEQGNNERARSQQLVPPFPPFITDPASYPPPCPYWLRLH